MTVLEKPAVRLFAALAGMLAAVYAQAEGKLYVQSPAVYAPDAGYVQKVKEECAVENKFADHVRNQASKRFSEVVPIKDLTEAGQEMVLGLTIFEIYGVGGGSWSGPKSITAEATLQRDGKVIGRFKDKNSSRGGAFGGIKGTCAILDRAAEHLADDIGKWLAKTIKDKSPIDSAKQQ